jgi:outer membrane beta-barrel protein
MLRRLTLGMVLVAGQLLMVTAASADKNPKPDPKKTPPAGKPASSAPTPPPPPGGGDQTPTLEIEPESQPTAPPTDNTGVPTIELPTTPDTGTEPGKPDTELAKAGAQHGSWQDIVVVVRKPFLKQDRLELIPSWGLTLNDNMIRHIMFDGRVNWWLTDVLSVGAEGQLFGHQFLEPYDLVARQYRRLPTLNEYNWGASVNFNYVPIYAKFAMFNHRIVHWELMATLGVGMTETQVIPRDPALPGWKNHDITPNVGLTARVFLASWLTLDLGVNDYIFVDKFESVMRKSSDSLDEAKAAADSRLINHIVFTAGVSFWFPMTFHYTTFR